MKTVFVTEASNLARTMYNIEAMFTFLLNSITYLKSESNIHSIHFLDTDCYSANESVSAYHMAMDFKSGKTFLLEFIIVRTYALLWLEARLFKRSFGEIVTVVCGAFYRKFQAISLPFVCMNPHLESFKRNLFFGDFLNIIWC